MIDGKFKQLYLSLGSNLGNREINLIKAREQLEKFFGSTDLASGIYETLPWGVSSTNKYLNQVLVYSTNLEALSCLYETNKIEKKLGRNMLDKGTYRDRLIDIDILFLSEETHSCTELRIPHPEIQNRRFVLQPLMEIAPEFIHPLLGKSVSGLLEECKDENEVKHFF